MKTVVIPVTTCVNPSVPQEKSLSIHGLRTPQAKVACQGPGDAGSCTLQVFCPNRNISLLNQGGKQ
jgi:hypothetical protein